MISLSSPSNYASFAASAPFRIKGSAADALTTVDALLEDADTGRVLAARRLKLDSAAEAVFDAAPVLRRAMTLQPAAGATGLAAADDCMFNVRLRVGDACTDSVLLLCTRPSFNGFSLLTTMPGRRTLRRGEYDRLLFFAMADFTLRIEAQQADGTVQTFRHEWNGSGGLVALRLRTADFGAGVTAIRVLSGSTSLVEYEVSEPSDEGLRLAWRSSLGTVEHYTFPAVVRRTEVTGNRTVRLADGTCTLSGESHTELTLRSRCEPSATVRALAEAATSPQVWADGGDAGVYTAVTVATQQVATHTFGEPVSVELTVRPSQNGVRL